MTINDIDFRNYTGEEALHFLRSTGRPEFLPLIRWIARGLAYEDSNRAVRVAIAEAERQVEKVTKEAETKP